MMGKRIAIGAVMIVLMCGLLWLDWRLEQAQWPRVAVGAGGAGTVVGLPLTALLAALIAVGCLELARLSAAAGAPVFRLTVLAATLALAALPFWRQLVDAGTGGDMLIAVVLAATLLALFVAQIARHGTEGVIGRVGASLLAVCYLGVCGAVLVGIRIDLGLPAMVLFLGAVKFADIGAYFVGSAIGRHKLIPRVSPKKSWEGLAGGLVVAAGFGAAAAGAMGPILGPRGTMGLGPWAAAGVAAALGLCGQVADVCESALKRQAGLKDSAALLPGFGGVLDIIDSPLLAAPAGYVLLALAT